MKFFILIIAVSISLFSQNKVSFLEIYQNKVIYHEIINLDNDSFSSNLPTEISLKDLSIKSKCGIKNTNFSDLELLKDDNFHIYENKKNNLNKLKNELKALNSKIDLLSSMSLQGSDMDKLKDISENFYDIYLKNLNDKATLEEKIKMNKNELDKIKPSYIKKINVLLDCKTEKAEIFYSLKDILVEKINDFDADIDKNKIYIKQSVFIKNPFSYDFKDLNLLLYPMDFSSNMKPYEFYPQYLDKENQTQYEYGAKKNFYKAIPANINNEEKANEQELILANSWKIEHVNIKAKDTTKVTYDYQSLDAKFDIFIDGYGSTRAYLRAKSSPKNHIENALGNFSIDGLSIGKIYINGFKKAEENTFYFGEMKLIDIRKEKIKDFTKDSFFKTEETKINKYKYKITNNSKKVWEIELSDKLPLSKYEQIKINYESKPKASKLKHNGEILWKFKLKPKENQEIIFSYEIIKPK